MKKKTIFIVDDDQMMTQMLSDHLSQNPLYEISTYSTGEDCIKDLTKDPAAIVLDYKLNTNDPGAADGLEILKQIKDIDENICVIMLSSQEQYGKALQTIARGAMEYVIKDDKAFSKVARIISSL